MEMRNELFPHPCVVDKVWEGYLGSKESQPHTRPTSPGFQGQEDKSPQLLAAKPSRVDLVEETYMVPSHSS